MEKINFEVFKAESKKLNGKDIFLKMEKVIETSRIFKNCNISTEINEITISDKNSKLKIDVNYISNFFKDEKILKCEINKMIEICISESK